VFDLVRRLVEDHVAISSPECTAGALWILHCWAFDRFEFTPRLALLSPVRGCGKSTFLRLIELLTPEPCRTDNATAAAIYHLLDRRPHTTLLIDEGDNLNLANNPVLRVVFNSGHQRGGSIRRYIGGWSRELPTFAPLAVSAIGALPLPFMHRSIRINMQRAAAKAGLTRLDAQDPVWAVARDQIRRWVTTCQLQPDPTMPDALFNRGADNFRVLFAIADDLGAGEEARAAALEISANHQDEDLPVILLADIQRVRFAHGGDHIATKALIPALMALNDGLWKDFKLTDTKLAQMLKPFLIFPKTIRLTLAERARGYTWADFKAAETARGYAWADFEAAWARYCPSPDTPTQSAKIMHLPPR